MYHIDSKVDKPDKSYLFKRVQEMMHRGIKVGDLDKLYRAFLNEQNKYSIDIRNNYGILNPNSSNQVIAYLEGLDDPNIVEVCAPQGKWSSNKSAMKTLDNLGYQIGRDLINYRTTKKYADSIKDMMDVMDRYGLIHPTVSMTKTNRISYKSPALMNIPKNLLWSVISPIKPGSVLISADIKNQEPSILINMNQINSLKPALEADEGLYESIFSQIPIYGKLHLIIDNNEKPGLMDNDELRDRGINPVFYTPKPVPFRGIRINGEEIKKIDIVNFVTPLGEIPKLPNKIKVVTNKHNIYEVDIDFIVDFNKAANKKKIKSGGIIEAYGELKNIEFICEGEVRKEFKTAWNAMTYGASRVGVRAMCRHIDGDLVYDFFTRIPELQEYRNRCNKLAYNKCQDVETYFGTVVTANEYNTSALKRVLMDLPIQGTAADILSLLVKHFDDEVIRRNYQNKMFIYYTRHDELIIEVTKELIDEIGLDGVKSELADILVHQVDDWVPFKLEIDEVELIDVKDIISGLEAEDDF